MRDGYLFLLFLAAAALPISAPAQESCYDAYLVGHYDGTKMQLRLSIGHRTFDNICRGNAVAFDLYRSTLGTECSSQVRVTDQPIPWPEMPSDGLFETFIDDYGVATDTGYRYEVRPVDAFRLPAIGTRGPIWGDAVAGVAPIAHGHLYSDTAVTGLVTVDGCPLECGTSGIVGVPSALRQYIDTETAVLLYVDDIGVIGPIYNAWFPSLSIASGHVALCVVGVEPTSWTAVKRLYE